jgi:hypothetical protein
MKIILDLEQSGAVLGAAAQDILWLTTQVRGDSRLDGEPELGPDARALLRGPHGDP